MSLIHRIQNLLLQPRTAWRRIDDTPIGSARIVCHLLLLALVPAICSFAGLSLFGAPVDGVTIRLPWQAGLVHAAATYCVLVVGVLLVALVAHVVAPTFGGRPSRESALKIAVYGSAAALLGGVFLLVPALSMLWLLAVLYSAYVVFAGLPSVMRSAPQKTVPFAAVLVLAGAVVGLLLSAVMARLTTHGMESADITLQTPGGKVRLDAASLEAASQKIADAAQRMEAASERQDAASAGQGAAPAVGTPPVTGGDPDTGAVPAPALKAALPERLGAFQRTAIEMHGGQVTGRVNSNARADYTNGEQRMRIEMIDLGVMSKLMASAGAAVQGERENSTVSERTWQENGRTLHENFRKDGSSAQYTTTLRNGVVVEVTGTRMNLDEVKAASSLLDLATLEKLQRRTLP